MVIHTMPLERKLLSIQLCFEFWRKTKFVLEAVQTTNCTVNSMHNSVKSTIHYFFPVCAGHANSAHFFTNGSDFDIIKVNELKLTPTTVPGTLKCSCILQDNNSTIASDSDSDCILLEETM